MRGWVTGILAGALGVALVSVLIEALDGAADPVGLASLYLLVIVPAAITWGFWVAAVITLAAYLTFAFFFTEPLHSFDIADSDTDIAIVISLLTAYVVSLLAGRANTRAEEAQARMQEADQAREELAQIAEEQAALRRVADLVARGAPTREVFSTVTREVGLQCDADLARMERFEADGTVTALASWSGTGESQLAVGERFALVGASIAAQVLETGQPARVDSFEGTTGPIAHEARALGIRSSVGCPIVVGGQTWGVIAASTRRATPFPPNTESRIGDFTELAATAVANAATQAELVASRARLVTAADDARRRVVRDLHDGAQQRFVHTIVTLKLAKRAEQNRQEEAVSTHLDEALHAAEDATAELRELAHGILPAALSRGGLAAGVDALTSRAPMPVRVDVPEQPFPPEIEASAYFIIAEALTNATKHARAERADVAASMDDGVLHLEVRDDGIGGARPDGSGLVGLQDRVAALGGQLAIESPPGTGTRIMASLPLPEG